MTVVLVHRVLLLIIRIVVLERIVLRVLVLLVDLLEAGLQGRRLSLVLPQLEAPVVELVLRAFILAVEKLLQDLLIALAQLVYTEPECVFGSLQLLLVLFNDLLVLLVLGSEVLEDLPVLAEQPVVFNEELDVLFLSAEHLFQVFLLLRKDIWQVLKTQLDFVVLGELHLPRTLGERVAAPIDFDAELLVEILHGQGVTLLALI